MQFTKYQGLGNDFVVVDVEDTAAVDPTRAQAICNRHFGVGADGVLLVSPSSSALARMTVLNADGSRPEMCGNGLRCVALHLSRRAGTPDAFPVETDAGVLECALDQRENDVWVTLSLGQGKPLGSVEHADGERLFHFERISMGNPHAVTFDAVPENDAIDRFAPQVSATLPGGANIEFVQAVGPTHLRVVVWERGVGRTLACGTGAGAVGVAAVRQGKVPYDTAIAVELPGGRLEITVEKETLAVQLAGPAREVFRGQLTEL